MVWCPFHCSIVPTHILENIAQNGGPAQRRRALRTLQLARLFRSTRDFEAQARRPFRRNPRVRWFDLLKHRWAEAIECEQERRIYDAQNTTRLPGRLVRGEGDPATNDPAVDEAYDGFGATFDLYFDEYERCSLDNRDMPLVGTVHYDDSFDNAFFDGRQMVFGDGDERDEDVPEAEKLWNRFTSAIDVIGHELTHGVVDRTAGLVYWFQPGALNEHLADVFGSMVKQKQRGQDAAAADWLIGEGLFTANVNGQAIRSMKEPGTAYDDPVLGRDEQPGHMDDFLDLPWWDDNGGVHLNSGIPNKAFFLAATNIGGFSWERAGHIWYQALISPTLSSYASFQQFAQETVTAAIDLFGSNSDEDRAVREAWAGVGVTVARMRAAV
jgi:Zn-dependent metalloprotease